MKRARMSLLVSVAALLLLRSSVASSNLTVYPVPDKSLLSSDYTVQVEGRDVPVYKLKVVPQDTAQRNSAMNDIPHTGEFFDEAAFACFDMTGGVQVSVTYKSPVSAARLLPAVPAIPVAVKGRTVSFSLAEPRNLTLEVNHQMVRTLHLFASPVEANVPSPNDPNVLFFDAGNHELSNLQVPKSKTIFYFGPGMHTIDHLVVHDGQSVYLAGGAVVRAVIRPGEPSTNVASAGAPARISYGQPAIQLLGSGIKLHGRGILDGSQALGKNLLKIEGQDISLEGIILQDAGTWNMPIQYSDRVTVTNVKVLGYRVNSDGIDIVSSRNVSVKRCFVRTLDDLIVIKSVVRDQNARSNSEVHNVLVQGNVLWDEGAHALSIGAEVEADVSDVKFVGNDVIRDLGREWPMRVYLSGSGTVSGTQFENNRIDRTGNPYATNTTSNFFSLSILDTPWRRAADRSRPLGKIRLTTVRNIQVVLSEPGTPAPKARINLTGASQGSDIEGVTFENVTINGQPLSKSNSVVNEKFATGVTGLP